MLLVQRTHFKWSGAIKTSALRWKHQQTGRKHRWFLLENSENVEFCIPFLIPSMIEGQKLLLFYGHFTKSRGNSQFLTVLGWIILGTACCKLLQLRAAPPLPIHPEIRMIFRHQTVIIPRFWNRLAPTEELFPGQSIKGYQFYTISSLDLAEWAWMSIVQTT